MADVSEVEIPVEIPSTNGNHEDYDVQKSPPSSDADVSPLDSAPHEEHTLHAPDKARDSTPRFKSPIEVPVGKVASSVKKIISSGTFGSGSAKSTVSKVALSPTKPTPVTSPAKKTTPGPQQPVKPSMHPRTTASAAATPPSRRASLAPTQKTLVSSTAKSPLSSSSTVKPASRISVVPSPEPVAGSKSSATARPRASVSEGIKRTSSLSKSATPPAARPSSGSLTATRTARTPGAGSISSISEVRVNEHAIELQQKLDEANASLSSRDVIVANLEGQVTEAKAALDTAIAELKEKRSALEQLEQMKAETELKLGEAENNFRNLQAERENDNSASMLETLQSELQIAKTNLLTEKDTIKHLQTQIESLESQVAMTKAELEAQRLSSESASANAAVAATVEHEAFLKAKADLEAVKVETDNLKATNSEALGEAMSKIRTLETRICDIVNLESELISLKSEKEENANRISELEIEVLEARESMERAEDDQARAVAQTKSLEAELTKAIAASELALKAKEEEYARQVEAVRTHHGEELITLKAEQETLSSQLVKLENALTDAQVSLEQAKAELSTNSEEHAAAIQSLEQSHQDKISDLNMELERVTKELEDQEKIYNAKVDVVKEEHERRLQDAFQRANDNHSTDLHDLRAESKAALAQVRSAYEESMQALKAEHATVLDERVKILEKQISNQNVDFKATQDDLSKAKAALSVSLQEFESVNLQLEEARKGAEAVASSAARDRALEFAKLNKDLSNAQADQAALRDILALPKQSFTEMSDNHAKELEEAAKSRAEEVTKLRAAHEAEIAALSREKSDLAVKLSDVEGELATLNAEIAAEPVSAPKSNGTVQIPPSTGVTKEEMQRLHEAHNLKINDMQAEFEKTLKVLKEDLDAARTKASELELEIGRKSMEISYLEQDQEENQDQITRLREDIDHLREEIKAKE